MRSCVVILLLVGVAAWVAPTPRRAATTKLNFLDQVLRGAPAAAAEADAGELFEILAESWRRNVAVDDVRASSLVDSLASSKRSFDAASLGGGLWLSLYTRGPKPRWQSNGEFLGRFGVRNRAGQAYDPAAGAVRNYGELFGDLASFSAEGTFEVPKNAKTLPVDVSVSISSGGLTVLGSRFELPISGPGLLRILYVDDRIRVFESPTDSPEKWEESGLVVVQVREDALAA